MIKSIYVHFVAMETNTNHALLKKNKSKIVPGGLSLKISASKATKNKKKFYKEVLQKFGHEQPKNSSKIQI